MRVTVEWTRTDDTETEKEYRVIGRAEPYIPAHISGPPERCYPAEGGGIEIRRIVDLATGRECAPSEFAEDELAEMEAALARAADDTDEYDDHDLACGRWRDER